MKYIHINQGNIRGNLKTRRTGRDQDLQPVITIKEGSKNTYCHEVAIKGPSRVLYGGNDKPILRCGARVVVATESEVEVLK